MLRGLEEVWGQDKEYGDCVTGVYMSNESNPFKVGSGWKQAGPALTAAGCPAN